MLSWLVSTFQLRSIKKWFSSLALSHVTCHLSTVQVLPTNCIEVVQTKAKRRAESCSCTRPSLSNGGVIQTMQTFLYCIAICARKEFPLCPVPNGWMNEWIVAAMTISKNNLVSSWTFIIGVFADRWFRSLPPRFMTSDGLTSDNKVSSPSLTLWVRYV